MARAVWKGSIGFGLVEIPVGVVAAEKPNELKLVYLDRRDLQPVGYKRYNKTTGEEVEWKDVVRGYEHEPGEFVVLSDADLERANPEATKRIEILHFAGEDEIDPVYYDRPYYLEPAQPGSKSYALLRATLGKTRKVGIAKVVLHTREHLAALRVKDDVIVLELLRFPYELRDPGDVEVPASGRGSGVGAGEVAIAEDLVERMTERFDPKKYEDTYRQDLLDLVEEKVESGQSHVITEPGDEEQEPVPETPIHDLVALLEKSLAGRGRAKVATKRARTAARRARPSPGGADAKPAKPRARPSKKKRSA